MPEPCALEESGKNLKTHLVQTLILHIRWKLQSAVTMLIKARVFLEVGERCQVPGHDWNIKISAGFKENTVSPSTPKAGMKLEG